MQIDSEIQDGQTNVEEHRMAYKKTETDILCKTTDTDMDELLKTLGKQQSDLRLAREKLIAVYQRRIDVRLYDKR